MTKNDYRQERDGGSKRVAAVVRALASAGFDVETIGVRPFASSAARATGIGSFWRAVPAVLRVFQSTIRTLSLSVLKWFSMVAIRQMVDITHQRQSKPTWVVVEFSQLATYRNALQCAVVLDMHNLEFELLDNYAASESRPLQRLAAMYEARSMRRLESRVGREFDVISVVSSHDRALLDRWTDTAESHATLVTAPNGVSEGSFAYEGGRRDTVVFVAHLGWRPNVDAAVWLAREVWPLVRIRKPTLRLQIIGRSPSPEVLKLVADDIAVIPDVESTVPFVGAARVATAPLHAAGGTRIKILEALAAGTPVVATSLGALGLDGLDPEALVIVDDPAKFAEQLVEMAGNEPDRSHLRDIMGPYRWDTTLSPLIDALVAKSTTERSVA
ncbi:glycosyltransferase [Rathayibacter sp. YIM 133350]|uniref:glycosyltransferase n=1 Tax=Rathayibacter sp. YIM 133350 TaxID=3131992 RepID=UPI00307E5745